MRFHAQTLSSTPAAPRSKTEAPVEEPQKKDSSARGEGPFHATVRFGAVHGIEIGANWSWFIVFGLITWSLAAAAFPDAAPGLRDSTYIAMALVAAVIFFTSLLLHELGHALVAQREGMEMSGITLWVFGGVAQFKGMFPSAAAEFRIAIAGPLVSVVLGAAFLTLGEVAHLPAPADAVVDWLGLINLVLVVFNMMPALPLDGGRVLRSIIWMSTNDFTRATRIAGALGRAIGQLMIAGGILLVFASGNAGGLWISLIGWFLTIAATAEMSLATIQGAFEGLHVRDAMVREPDIVPATASLREFVDEEFPRGRHAAYPVSQDGHIVGLLSFRAAMAVPSQRWSATTVGEAMLPLETAPHFGSDESLGDAAIDLNGTSLGRALVFDGDEAVGLISTTDVSRMLELRRAAGR